VHLKKLLEVKRHSTRFAFPFAEIIMSNHVLREFVLGVEAVNINVAIIFMFKTMRMLLTVYYKYGIAASCWDQVPRESLCA
jgi:hypothetical protein